MLDAFWKLFTDETKQAKLVTIWWACGFVLTLIGAFCFYRRFGFPPAIAQTEYRRASMSVMLKPWLFLPWVVLVTLGTAWPWKMRKTWTRTPDLKWMFFACTISILSLFVNLVVLHWHAS
jgi:hypothetical protein